MTTTGPPMPTPRACTFLHALSYTWLTCFPTDDNATRVPFPYTLFVLFFLCMSVDVVYSNKALHEYNSCLLSLLSMECTAARPHTIPLTYIPCLWCSTQQHEPIRSL